MNKLKSAFYKVAALTALSCIAVTTGCQHTRDGGGTGTGTGGTIDKSGTMDQGNATGGGNGTIGAGGGY